MSDDMKFMVETLSSELVGMLIEKYQWSMKKALDYFFRSETFKKLCDPQTGLYFQGPVYVFSFLEKEVETGKPV